MKIKNHDDFPKLDHRSAPSFWVERDWVIDSPPIPRARPGDGGTINWGIFKRHFWGELLRHQQGTRVSPSTVSDLSKKIYATIEAWRNRPIGGEHPYVYLDGIVLKRSWAGEVRNVSLLVAIGVNESGYRDILGICEGAKEDKAGWSAFLKHLKDRGLKGIRLITSDACIGLAESAAEFFPETVWQRCVVHSHVPST